MCGTIAHQYSQNNEYTNNKEVYEFYLKSNKTSNSLLKDSYKDTKKEK
jgi:hypothetical protein